MISDILYDYADELFKTLLPEGDRAVRHRICEYITCQYECKNRGYHSQWHIIDVLEKLDKYISERPFTPFQNEIRMALLLHDVIYDVPNMGLMSNEAKSAEIFNKIVKLLPELRNVLNCSLVSELILSTQYGSEFEATKEDSLAFRLVHDIDFSSLGEDYDRFILDGQRIRKEYWLASDEEFKAGRSAFFQMMLNKEDIYLTDYYQDKCEAIARSNMKAYMSEAHFSE